VLTRKHLEPIPAIDVLEGRVVRLREGKRDDVTIEGGDPVELAKRFAAEGARRLHVVDLDGAFNGTPSLGLLERLAGAAPLPLQVGGGLRTVELAQQALAAGADRVMIGTAALSPGFLEEAVPSLGEALVVAVDARDGQVAVEGWTRTEPTTATELARRCAEAGVARLLVTSTRRDGSLAGPDLELLGDIVPIGVPVIAAGGVSSLADLTALEGLGCEAAICGSALLTGRFTLAEALALADA
jgi:phosphoribosylformimino-5-aminoimidazole carboxamide ribotide isomerase